MSLTALEGSALQTYDIVKPEERLATLQELRANAFKEINRHLNTMTKSKEQVAMEEANKVE